MRIDIKPGRKLCRPKPVPWETDFQVADLARAAEVYARRQKLSQEAIDYATACKIDAMTLMGEFLRAAKPQGPDSSKREESGTGRLAGREKVVPKEIGYKESTAAQAIAELKEKDPEAHAEVRAGQFPLEDSAPLSWRSIQSRTSFKPQLRSGSFIGICFRQLIASIA